MLDVVLTIDVVIMVKVRILGSTSCLSFRFTGPGGCSLVPQERLLRRTAGQDSGVCSSMVPFHGLWKSSCR